MTAPGVANLSSVVVGTGQRTELTVNTDNDRELEAIAMQFAGTTGRRGLTNDTIYAGLGTPVDFASAIRSSVARTISSTSPTPFTARSTPLSS